MDGREGGLSGFDEPRMIGAGEPRMIGARQLFVFGPGQMPLLLPAGCGSIVSREVMMIRKRCNSGTLSPCLMLCSATLYIM